MSVEFVGYATAEEYTALRYKYDIGKITTLKIKDLGAGTTKDCKAKAVASHVVYLEDRDLLNYAILFEYI
jgi:hypothetical protein